MHEKIDYEAGGFDYQSADETRREYRQLRAPKLYNRKKKRARNVQCGLNRRRNKHWSW